VRDKNIQSAHKKEDAQEHYIKVDHGVPVKSVRPSAAFVQSVPVNVRVSKNCARAAGKDPARRARSSAVLRIVRRPRSRKILCVLQRPTKEKGREGKEEGRKGTRSTVVCNKLKRTRGRKEEKRASKKVSRFRQLEELFLPSMGPLLLLLLPLLFGGSSALAVSVPFRRGDIVSIAMRAPPRHVFNSSTLRSPKKAAEPYDRRRGEPLSVSRGQWTEISPSNSPRFLRDTFVRVPLPSLVPSAVLEDQDSTSSVEAKAALRVAGHETPFVVLFRSEHADKSINDGLHVLSDISVILSECAGHVVGVSVSPHYALRQRGALSVAALLAGSEVELDYQWQSCAEEDLEWGLTVMSMMGVLSGAAIMSWVLVDERRRDGSSRVLDRGLESPGSTALESDTFVQEDSTEVELSRRHAD
jgi:hypothetical protein